MQPQHNGNVLWVKESDGRIVEKESWGCHYFTTAVAWMESKENVYRRKQKLRVWKQQESCKSADNCSLRIPWNTKAFETINY